MGWCETSAKEGTNLGSLMQSVVHSVLEGGLCGYRIRAEPDNTIRLMDQGQSLDGKPKLKNNNNCCGSSSLPKQTRL